MDIAGVSMALSTISTQSQIGTAVLGKAMDTNRELGEGLIQMIDAAAMERSVNPEVGANFDMRI
ncbi:MAG: YjfB family protein [Roseburia sp.]|nr:YjfB family protein [Roseburia sp.]